MMQLTSREKYYLIGAGIICLVFLVCQFVIFPSLDHQKKTQRLVEEKRQELQQVQAMRQRYLALTGSEGSSPQVSKGTGHNPLSLFSTIENTAKSAKLSGKIEYMRPIFSEGAQAENEVSVELKLDGLQMQDVVNFLTSLQDRINIKRFDLQKNDRNLLELMATLAVRQSG